MNISYFISHVSVDGHCFPFGAVMNNAAVYICGQFLCGHIFSFILGTCRAAGCLGHVVTRYLTCSVMAAQISKVAVAFIKLLSG